MFPAVSILRRSAATQIFVRPDKLQLEGNRYWLSLKSPSSSLDLATGKWGPILDRLPMSMLKVISPSSESAAIALVKKENELAEGIGAMSAYYTLVFGPETEVEKEGQIHRAVRLCVVRGVYRAAGPTAIEPSPVKQPLGRRFAKRRGIAYEELP